MNHFSWVVAGAINLGHISTLGGSTAGQSGCRHQRRQCRTRGTLQKPSIWLYTQAFQAAPPIGLLLGPIRPVSIAHFSPYFHLVGGFDSWTDHRVPRWSVWLSSIDACPRQCRTSLQGKLCRNQYLVITNIGVLTLYTYITDQAVITSLSLLASIA